MLNPSSEKPEPKGSTETALRMSRGGRLSPHCHQRSGGREAAVTGPARSVMSVELAAAEEERARARLPALLDLARHYSTRLL